MRKIIAAGGLVFNNERQLLMILRRGKWDLPKGKLDNGESIEECARREVTEETGVKNLEIVNFLGITEHSYFDNWISEDVIKETHWFVMKTTGENMIKPQTEEDIEEIEWIDSKHITQFTSMTYPNIRSIIQKYYEGRI